MYRARAHVIVFCSASTERAPPLLPPCPPSSPPSLPEASPHHAGFTSPRYTMESTMSRVIRNWLPTSRGTTKIRGCPHDSTVRTAGDDSNEADDDDDDDDDGDDGDGGENGGGSGGGWRGGGRRRRRGASQKVHVKLDVKGFEQALSCSALAPENLVCCLYRVTKGVSYLRGPTFSSSSMLIQLGRVSVPVTRNTLNQTWLPRLGQSCHHQL